LGHEQRLSLFYLLVQAGHSGLTVGEIHLALGRLMSTVVFHFRESVDAGMVAQTKEGRSVRCTASFDSLNEMLDIVRKECCKGVTPPTAAEKKRKPKK
jgi:DNA-binding transcriptional ArsR family regulator